jgi:hypothetical protein
MWIFEFLSVLIVLTDMEETEMEETDIEETDMEVDSSGQQSYSDIGSMSTTDE